MPCAWIACGTNLRMDDVLRSFRWTTQTEIIRRRPPDDPIFDYPPGAPRDNCLRGIDLLLAMNGLLKR